MKLTGGCNVYSAEYKAYQNGSFSIVHIIPITKVNCIFSYDSEYVNALSNSVKFEKTLNQIKLRDKSNLTTIILTRVNQVAMVTFSGVFMSNIS
jgi:hypothetical protein